ncbi:hypothetical protein J6590_075534 [Homalodisca vitripennis]|nr:hypothetical protein J6590_075534 [Homalodisca vitripennis]
MDVLSDLILLGRNNVSARWYDSAFHLGRAQRFCKLLDVDWTWQAIALVPFRCRLETVSSFSVTAPLSLFQRGLGGDRAVGGESNLAPHPATDDPPLQQGEQSTAQGEATRDRQSVYSHKGRRPCV